MGCSQSKIDPESQDQSLLPDDALLVWVAMNVCRLSYRTSRKKKQNAEREKSYLEHLDIQEYRVWYAKNENNEMMGGPLAITGLIRDLTDSPEKIYVPFVCFRGTQDLSDMAADFELGFFNEDLVTDSGKVAGQVGRGGLEHYNLLKSFDREGRKILPTILETVEKSNDKRLFIFGHSLGGAIASIFTTEMRLDHPHIVTITVTIGGARALSKELADYIHNHADADTIYSESTKGTNGKVEGRGTMNTHRKHRFIRMLNDGDIVPCLGKFNDIHHVGQPVALKKAAGSDDILQIIPPYNTAINWAGYLTLIVTETLEFLAGGAYEHLFDTNGGYSEMFQKTKSFRNMFAQLSPEMKKRYSEGLPLEVQKDCL